MAAPTGFGQPRLVETWRLTCASDQHLSSYAVHQTIRQCDSSLFRAKKRRAACAIMQLPGQ
eukprot:3388242-Amphidinium_carterae.1